MEAIINKSELKLSDSKVEKKDVSESKSSTGSSLEIESQNKEPHEEKEPNKSLFQKTTFFDNKENNEDTGLIPQLLSKS